MQIRRKKGYNFPKDRAIINVQTPADGLMDTCDIGINKVHAQLMPHAVDPAPLGTANIHTMPTFTQLSTDTVLL